MPVPTKRARMAGFTTVYTRFTINGGLALGPWVETPQWKVESIELGSRDRISTATLILNRDYVLRGTLPDPFIQQDSHYLIAYKESANAGITPCFLFEGVPSNTSRLISGQPKASTDEGRLELVDSTTLYSSGTNMQIAGRIMISDHTVSSTAVLINDITEPCVFNQNGLPNRSIQTAMDQNIFLSAPDMYYFLDNDGYGFYNKTGVIRTRKAHYWTYAQAIAYVLQYWAGSGLPTSQNDNPGGRNPLIGTQSNFVHIYYGSPIAIGDPNFLWEVIKGRNTTDALYRLEPLGVLNEGDTPPPQPVLPTLSLDPDVLLRKQINNLSIEGLSVIEALSLILHSAGLGWYIDHKIQQLTPPDPFVLRYKVWTPGGVLNPNGVGDLFYPRLQPYQQDISQQTDVDTLRANNAKDLSLNWDGSHILNKPILIGSPSENEITVELRPGWKPIHDPDIFFLDNINPNASITDSLGFPHNELSMAYAEAHRAFTAWLGNPEFYTDLDSSNAIRVGFLARMLHAKGDLHNTFPDILRKWILPTDHRYPDPIYRRDGTASSDMPTYYTTYNPVSFNNDATTNPPPQNLYMLHPIVGSDSWPAKGYPLFPTVTTDIVGNSLGVVVELSFDKGINWMKWTSFTTLPDELGIMLSFVESICML